MFRKPKRGAKAGVRRRKSSDDSDDDDNKKASATDNAADEDEEEENTSALLSEARKRTKLTGKFNATQTDSNNITSKKPLSAAAASTVMHQFATSAEDIRQRNADLTTSTVEVHPNQQRQKNLESGAAEVGSDGIFRDKTRSKLLAGPIKVTTSIRTTARFDYQPDICKDYKETGFCGFGDTCIYLHDRGDTKSGWQIEKEWEEAQKRKKEEQQREIEGFLLKSTNGTAAAVEAEEEKKMAALLSSDDGLPYACHICRTSFTNPVVTSCGHYFCEQCIMNRVRNESETCPICGKDTHGVFNQPTKLISKKRKVLGAADAKKENSWELYAKAFASNKTDDED